LLTTMAGAERYALKMRKTIKKVGVPNLQVKKREVLSPDKRVKKGGGLGVQREGQKYRSISAGPKTVPETVECRM